MSCAVRVGFSPRGARAIQYAVASATDDDKAVKPLGKQILDVFSCRSNTMEDEKLPSEDTEKERPYLRRERFSCVPDRHISYKN